MRVDIRVNQLGLAAVDKVFLEGDDQHLCIMADTDKGEIERYKTNPQGEIIVTDGEAETEIIKGCVTIQFKEGWHMDADGDYTLNGRKF